MANPYEVNARREKANAIANALFAHGITAAQAVRMNDGQWTMAAQGARVHVPSTTTRTLVVETLAQIERAAEANRGLDPFRGF